MLSGSVTPFVSGRIKQIRPAKKAVAANIAVGNQGNISTIFETNGAIIAPILIAVEQAPRPIFLTTVGYNSVV